jgi:hypothetical protein
VRPARLRQVLRQGRLSKHYKWDSTGELQAPTVYGYKVDNGKIVPIGTIG